MGMMIRSTPQILRLIGSPSPSCPCLCRSLMTDPIVSAVASSRLLTKEAKASLSITSFPVYNFGLLQIFNHLSASGIFRSISAYTAVAYAATLLLSHWRFLYLDHVFLNGAVITSSVPLQSAHLLTPPS